MIKNRKRIFFILILQLTFFSFFSESIHAETYLFSGAGTTEQPFEISMPSELFLLAEKVNEGDTLYANAHYILMNDIDASYNGNHTPIGFGVNYSFNGTFSGNGHEISNILLDYDHQVSNDKYLGLFGYNNGTIRNLRINGDINITGRSGAYGGGVSGYNKGTIENVESSVNICGFVVGGIVGRNYGTVSDSAYSGTLDSWYMGGGIAGYNYGTLQHSINNGSIHADNTGGIAANNNKDIHSCVNLGTVNGDITAGGISDKNGDGFTASTIINSLNLGSVTGGISGGLTGHNGVNGRIKTSYSVGNINGVTYGGVIGENLGIADTIYHSSFFEKGIGTGGGKSTPIENELLTTSLSFNGFDFESDWKMNEGNIKIPVPSGHGIININEGAQYLDGLGTVYDPFLIKDLLGLDEVRKFPGAFYEVMNDLAFSEADFVSTGRFYNDGALWNPISEFYGFSMEMVIP